MNWKIASCVSVLLFALAAIAFNLGVDRSTLVKPEIPPGTGSDLVAERRDIVPASHEPPGEGRYPSHDGERPVGEEFMGGAVEEGSSSALHFYEDVILAPGVKSQDIGLVELSASDFDAVGMSLQLLEMELSDEIRDKYPSALMEPLTDEQAQSAKSNGVLTVPMAGAGPGGDNAYVYCPPPLCPKLEELRTLYLGALFSSGYHEREISRLIASCETAVSGESFSGKVDPVDGTVRIYDSTGNVVRSTYLNIPGQ